MCDDEVWQKIESKITVPHDHLNQSYNVVVKMTDLVILNMFNQKFRTRDSSIPLSLKANKAPPWNRLKFQIDQVFSFGRR